MALGILYQMAIPPLLSTGQILNDIDFHRRGLWKKAFIGVVVSTLPMNWNTRPPGPPSPLPSYPSSFPPYPGPWEWKTMWDGAHAPV